MDTLHTYLNACAELHSDVKVHVILVALVERLAAYGQRQQALGQPPIPPHIPLFDIFSDQIGNIAQVIQNFIFDLRLFFKIIMLITFWLKFNKGPPGNAARKPCLVTSFSHQLGLPLLSGADQFGR